MDTVRFDGVEKLLQDWIRPQLGGPRVSADLAADNTLSTESLLLFRTGGQDDPATIRTDRPLITLEARAATKQRADEILGQARALMLAAGRSGAILGGRQIYSVTSAGGVGNLPDPVTRQPRYTWLCEVHIAGVHT